MELERNRTMWILTLDVSPAISDLASLRSQVSRGEAERPVCAAGPGMVGWCPVADEKSWVAKASAKTGKG